METKVLQTETPTYFDIYGDILKENTEEIYKHDDKLNATHPTTP